VDIANKFADVFANACSPFSAEHFNTARSKFFDKRFDLLSCNMSKHSECSISFVDDIIQKLKRNKAASLDGLAAEHILYSHPVAVSVITKLINLMLRFEYIPDAFGFSVTIPLPKDNSSKVQGVTTNYRGKTVSPIISTIVELCLLNMFKKYLGSEDMQFGFKKNVGTNREIFSVCKVVNYFTKNDSTDTLLFTEPDTGF